MKPPVREKRHRLPPAAYNGQVVVAFTMCVERRARLFTREEVVAKGLEFLTDQLQRFECTCPIYCFMPDHIHLILSGQSKAARPKAAADAFKCKWTEYLKDHNFREDMQKDYFDHIIRKRDDWKEQVWYVAANPVRAGIVTDWREYPFTGSIGVSLYDVLGDIMWS